MKHTRAEEIANEINGNGGFDNFRRWEIGQIAEWVRYNFGCTWKTATKVVELINIH